MEMATWSILAYVVAIAVLVLIGRLLMWPMRRISRLVLNSLLGGAAIILLNLIGVGAGFHIAINPLNALIVGAFGIPGALMLLVLPLFLV